jgi:hypothetical protein
LINDADDSQFNLLDDCQPILRNRKPGSYCPSDGITLGPQLIRKNLVNNREAFFIFGPTVKIATSNEWNIQRLEVSRRHHGTVA